MRAHRAIAMDSNDTERTTHTEEVANGRLRHHDETHRTDPSVPEDQHGLYEQVDRLRLEVERLRDQQQALQRTPQSNDLDADEVEDHEADDSNARDPADRRGVLHRRPLKLVLALVIAAMTSVGGLRFWNDGRDVYDVLLALFDYPEGFNLSLRVNFVDGGEESEGFLFTGSQGLMEIAGNTVTVLRISSVTLGSASLSTRPSIRSLPWTSFQAMPRPVSL